VCVSCSRSEKRLLSGGLEFRCYLSISG